MKSSADETPSGYGSANPNAGIPREVTVVNADKRSVRGVAPFVVAVLLGSLAIGACHHYSWRGHERLRSLLDVSLRAVEVSLPNGEVSLPIDAVRVRPHRQTVLTDEESLRYLKSALAGARYKSLHDLVEEAKDNTTPRFSHPREAKLVFSDGSECRCSIQSIAEHQGLRIAVHWSEFDLDNWTYDVMFHGVPPPPLGNFLADMFDGTENHGPGVVRRFDPDNGEWTHEKRGRKKEKDNDRL